MLTTKEEAREFTDFFKNIIKGSSNVFLFVNNHNGQVFIARLMNNELSTGESEGGAYSFS